MNKVQKLQYNYSNRNLTEAAAVTSEAPVVSRDCPSLSVCSLTPSSHFYSEANKRVLKHESAIILSFSSCQQIQKEIMNRFL